MKIQVSKLVPHPLNREVYSLSDVDDLVASINEVGLLQPLVIDQKNRVISGNRRLSAIRKLQKRTVAVERVKVSNREVGRLLVHHNKQRIKTSRELLNEYHILKKYYSVGQGKRTDLSTSDRTIRGSTTRDIISDKLGVSSGQLSHLLFIEKENKELVDLIDKGILTVNQAYLQVSSVPRQRQLDRRGCGPRRLSFKVLNRPCP